MFFKYILEIMYFTDISQKRMQSALIAFFLCSRVLGWDFDGLSSGDLDVLSSAQLKLLSPAVTVITVLISPVIK